MPQQNIDFSEGPFSNALKPMAPRPAPITGYEGTAAAIGNIATNFLKGVAETRTRNFQKKEMERMRGIQALQGLAGMVPQMGLTPAAQQKAMLMLTQPLVQQVANADDGGGGKQQQGGNPIFHALKQMAINMTGGENPVKVKPIDQNAIGQFVAALTDETQFPRANKVMADAQSLFDKAWEGARDKQTGQVSQQALMGNPQYEAFQKMLAEHGLEMPTSVKSRMQTALNPEMDMLYQGQAQYNNMLAGRGAPQPPQPNVESTTLPTQQPASPFPLVAGAVQGFTGTDNPTAYTEPPTPKDTRPQPTVAPIAAVANAAASPLGQVSPISPMVRNYMNRTGIKPDEYFLYKSPTDHIAVVDYGNGVVREKGTNREVNLDTAKQLGYTNRNTIPMPPDKYEPERIAGTRKSVEAEIDTVQGMTPQMKQRLLSQYDSSATSNPDAAASRVSASIERFVRDREARAERAQRQAELAQTRSEARDLKTENFKQDLRREVEAHPDVKAYSTIARDYNNAKTAYEQVVSGKSQMPGYQDLTLIRALAKITDPLTGVRDAEQALFGKAQGLLASWQTKVEQGWRNGAVLSPQARKELMSLVDQLHATARSQAMKGVEPVMEQARGMKFRESSILPEYLRGAKAEPTWNPPTPTRKLVK